MANAEQTTEVRTLRSNERDTKVRNLCLDIFRAKVAEQEAKQRYAELQAKMQAYMDKSGDKGLQFSYRGKFYKIISVKPQKFVWDVEKLIKRIKKINPNSDEVLSQIIENKIYIQNVQDFKKLLKENGIKYEQIKPFLNIERKVNQKKINELSEIGEMTFEEIQGCYTLEDSKSYLLPTESEIEDE